MKSNPKYSKMFAALATKTVEELKDAFTIAQLLATSAVKSITLACIAEELECRVGSEQANEFVDAFYA